MIPEVLNSHLQCGAELTTASKEERKKLILSDVCVLSFLLACNLQLKNNILYFRSKASIFLKLDVLLTSGSCPQITALAFSKNNTLYFQSKSSIFFKVYILLTTGSCPYARESGSLSLAAAFYPKPAFLKRPPS